MITFVVDPNLARESILAGRTLIIEVTDAKHYRAVIGPPSKHVDSVAKGKAA